jgi:hypothetical protein
MEILKLNIKAILIFLLVASAIIPYYIIKIVKLIDKHPKKYEN